MCLKLTRNCLTNIENFTSKILPHQIRIFGEFLGAQHAFKWRQSEVNSVDVTNKPGHSRKSLSIDVASEETDSMNRLNVTSQIVEMPVAQLAPSVLSFECRIQPVMVLLPVVHVQLCAALEI